MNRLEKNGVKLSILGLGIEHFVVRTQNPDDMTREQNSKVILEAAYDLGLTHYDIVFNIPYFYDVFKDFIKDKREKITFTAHLGSIFSPKGPNHRKSRSLKAIKSTYEGMLDRIDVEYADIALHQFVTHMEDFEKIVKGGVLDYAKELKREGRAKAIGFSAHKPELLLKILQKEQFDVIMFPLNFSTGILDSTQRLIKYCKKNEIAIIAIKNLLKGKAFSTKKTNYSAYYTGRNKFSLKLIEPSTPAQCFQYGLEQQADSIIFGVKTVAELQENIESYNREKGTANYSKTLNQFKQVLKTY